MPKRDVENCTIEITHEAFDKIQSWGQALSEVMFLAIGKDNKITDASRVTNISRAPRNYCDYSKKEFNEKIKEIEANGLEVVCMGHSHPHKNHLRYPSKSDWQYLPKKFPQLIVFPHETELKGWIFSTTYSKTLESSIDIKLLKKQDELGSAKSN